MKLTDNCLTDEMMMKFLLHSCLRPDDMCTICCETRMTVCSTLSYTREISAREGTVTVSALC